MKTCYLSSFLLTTAFGQKRPDGSLCPSRLAMSKSNSRTKTFLPISAVLLKFKTFLLYRNTDIKKGCRINPFRLIAACAIITTHRCPVPKYTRVNTTPKINVKVTPAQP